MSEILGHDCDGRSLRAGDRVVIQSVCRPYNRKFIGRTAAIRGPAPKGNLGDVELDIPFDGPHWDYCTADGDNLRRIDDRPELGSWDEIEKITGWNPTKQPVEA